MKRRIAALALAALLVLGLTACGGKKSDGTTIKVGATSRTAAWGAGVAPTLMILPSLLGPPQAARPRARTRDRDRKSVV